MLSIFNKALIGLLVAASVLSFSIDAEAQKKKKKKNSKATEKQDEKKDDTKKVSDAIKRHMVYEGLFDFYQDSISGEMKMLVKENQIGKEYIHFYYIENGPTEAGAFRGQFRGSRIFKIEKYFNRIEFTLQNTSSYFDPDNALSKSKDANISRAILFSGKIEAGSKEEGQYLISADDVFLQETFGIVKLPPPPKPDPKAFKLGNLSKSKTKIKKIKNYPSNSDLVIEYVYENNLPKNFGSRAVTDARNVSILVQHSIIRVPKNDFEPRFDDPRIGFFTRKVTDMTSLSATPYRDMIIRWHLKKKDKEAELSEPLEPIVYWIENTTPEKLRPVIKRAGEAWNKAFEKAGFRNAVVIKIQSDDADWDAGDIRYNVLRWTSSPNPPFGGYGPAFVNPRTGQILGADIMLEFPSVGSLYGLNKVFETSGMEMFSEEGLEHQSNENYCNLGGFTALQNAFGNISLGVLDEDEYQKEKLIEEFIHFLILHEMGHTLGLNHNFKATHLHSLEDINDVSKTSAFGLYGSVMDYPSINFSRDRENQGQYWTTTPGPYDVWAIEFGYSEVNSADELEAILSRSTSPELMFANDADDMRAPGKGIDPRAMIGDLTDDPVDYAISRIALTQQISEVLLEKYNDNEGESYQELRNAYLAITSQYAAAAFTISRFIGGVLVDRSMIGQAGAAEKPYLPVSKEDQVKAMQALTKYVFDTDAFKMPSELYSYLQPQRRGFDFFGTTEDPKIHSRVIYYQKNILKHLLHPNTLERISDTELYGNEYDLGNFMTDLNDAIFEADQYKPVSSFRQNLQLAYTKMLIDMIQAGNYTNMSKSMALYNLNEIKKIAARNSQDISTKAHRQHLAFIIEKALDDD